MFDILINYLSLIILSNVDVHKYFFSLVQVRFAPPIGLYRVCLTSSTRLLN